MLKKKYVFETRTTRFYRYLKLFFVLLVIPLGAYLFYAFSLVQLAEQENEKSRQFFFKKQPDLIAVFTGDAGRIEYSFQKAIEYPESKVFITGVYSQNTIETLVKKFYPDKSLEGRLPEFVEIDYLATNTIENVISTLRYLRQNDALKTVLIVSSDYHLVRIKHITEKLKAQDDPYQFYYYGTESNFYSLRGIKILLTEVFKNLKTRAFLFLWNSEDHHPLALRPSSPR